MVDNNRYSLIEEYERRSKQSAWFGIPEYELREIVEETNNQREDMYLKYAYMAGYKAALKTVKIRVSHLLDPGVKQSYYKGGM